MESPEVKEPAPSLSHTQVRQTIFDGASLSKPYLIMNGLATIVASYGLLANSPAVVIGAMIIAMLLGPIMGLALAMVDGDTRLLRQSLLAEAIGVALVVGLAYLIGRLHHDIDLTNEILVRTRPNLIDLIVALAGGAAGAYATVSPKISVGLVGVAIATALVPPLASCGICLSRGLISYAGGAFILFATNLVAIQCASSVVLYWAGFHRVTERQEGDTAFVRRLILDGALFASLSVFLYTQLAQTIQQQVFQKSVREILVRELRGIPGAYLSETRFIRDPDSDIVVALVRAPYSISPAQTGQLEDVLVAKMGRPIELHIRSQLIKETTANGYLHVIEPQAPPVDEPPPPIPFEEFNGGSAIPDQDDDPIPLQSDGTSQ